MTALCVGAAGPVGAQEFGVLEIDPHKGAVGDVVAGVVDPGVVAEHCEMDLATVMAQFADGSAVGPVADAWLELGALLGLEPSDANIFLFGNLENHEQQAWSFGGLGMALGIGSDPEVAEEYWLQTFVLTFADLQTQETVGEISSFDPNTGIGEVDVPEVEPGLWAVAATCVEPEVTDESFLAAIAAGAAFLDEIDLPTPWEPTLQGLTEMAEAIMPVMLPELMVPQDGAGPWVDIYCVLDADGQCHPDLRHLTLAELEALEDDGLLGDLQGDLPATPVGASPRFTG